MQPFRLLRFRNRIEWEFLLSLPGDRLRTVLAVKGSLRRAEDGAPLTAPGRPEQDLPNMRKRRVWKLMATASLHLASSRPDHVRATTLRGACTAAEGLDAETFRGFPLAGDLFLLTSFFIEPISVTSDMNCCRRLKYMVPGAAGLTLWPDVSLDY